MLLAGAAVFTPALSLATVYDYAVTNTNDTGTGSLRRALELASDRYHFGEFYSGDSLLVYFNISPGAVVHTITPDTNLSVNFPVTIDGTTQPGYGGTPLIELKGGDGAQHGLTVLGTHVTVRGLAINNFPGDGINTGNANVQFISGLEVTGCHIGTNAAGTSAIPNGGHGISLGLAFSSRIGETGTNQGNVISGNGGHGIRITSGTTAAGVGIYNNRIGTNRAGAAALGNGGNGVDITSSISGASVVIGSSLIGGRNVISGNAGTGIAIWRGVGNAYIRNNVIGLAADGSTDLGNGEDGVSAEPLTTDIGGTGVGEGSIISGNARYGVHWFMSRYAVLPETYYAAHLCNNLIGTDASGTAARPNTLGGVLVDVSATRENGNAPEIYAPIGAGGAGNVIAGNGGPGVTVIGQKAEVMGNFIGVTRTGAVLPNNGAGIRVIDSEVKAGLAPNPGNGNVIGGNTSHGIQVTGTSSLTAHGNLIGVTAAGADIGNGGSGIQQGPWVGTGIAGVTSIGGAGAGMGNTIAFNNGDGIWLTEPFGIGSSYLSILGNSIYANSGLGIDLGPDGVTLNDPGDADTGANHRQNFPVLLAATPTKILGSVSSTPNTRFRIELFRAEADATSYGEGRYFLGSVTATSDATGLATFGLTGLSLTAGQSVTATASVIGAHPDPLITTPVIQDTSEFSQNLTVGAEVASVGFASSAYTINESIGSAALTLVRSGVTTGTSTVTYTAYSGTAIIGADLPPATGTVTFSPGQTQRTLILPIVNDTIHEGAQTFSVFLTFPVNCLLQSPTSTVVTITDNDPMPVVFVPAAISVTEGHTGGTTVEIPVTLSVPSELPVNVEILDLIGTTAEYGPDYVLQPGQSTLVCTIAPGESSFTYRYTVWGDTTVEPDEIFGLRIAAFSAQIQQVYPTNATIGNATCVVTIVNDDDASPGVVQFSSAAYTAAENSGSVTITVTRTGGTGGAATVNYSAAGGTAAAGSDFVAANAAGTLNFAHGQSSASFTISLLDDAAVEGPETILLQLSGNTGAGPGSPVTATLTLSDNETPGTLRFAAANTTVSESAGLTTVTVSRVNGTDGPASVNYSISGGTAAAGSDYNPAGTTGTLNFASGQSTASFTFTIFDDATAENSETILFQLAGATGAALGSPATTTLTITDNDTSLSISGRVADNTGAGIPGVTVSLAGGQTATFTTDSTGNYTFSNLTVRLNYTVSATASGWTFAPASHAVTNLTASVTGRDFTGTPEPAPELAMHIQPDGSILLTWPAPSTGWILVGSTDLSAGSWHVIAHTPNTLGLLNQVTLPATTRYFFRLQRDNGGGSGGEEM